jgi:BASS family bile acid:Na+ symporter
MTSWTLIAKLLLVTFVASSMLSTGAGLTVAEILGPLRDRRLLVRALLANFVLVPLTALLLGWGLRLEQGFALGLLLVGCAAGDPVLLKLAQIARGNFAFAVGLMALQLIVTIGYLPLVLPALIPGVTVDPWKIAKPLLVLMLLPLVLGLILKARYGLVAKRVKPLLEGVSNISLVLFVVLFMVLNFDKLRTVFGTHGILAALVFTPLSFGIGWVLGRPTKDIARVMSVGTAWRNISASLVVGSTLGDPKIHIMVIVVAVIGFAILLPLAGALGKRSPGGATPPRAASGP